MMTLVETLSTSLFHVHIARRKGIQRNCRRLTQKDKASTFQEQKGKPSDQKGNFLDIVEVQTQHLSNCSCSFPEHLLGPHDLLRTIGQINGSQVNYFFDIGSSHNFIDDHLVQMLGLRTNISDRTYRVHLANRGLLYINGVIL